MTDSRTLDHLTGGGHAAGRTRPLRRRRHAATLGVALTLLLSLLTACEPVPPQPHQWIFTLNTSDPLDSRLRWMSGWSQLATWRAGAGRGTTIDDCISDVGPLPPGTYDITGVFLNYQGQVITGPALRLSDKVCHDGSVVRWGLFVHSSYPWTPNRYASEGCIKVSSTGSTGAVAGGAIRDVYNKHHVPSISDHLVVW